MENKLVNWNFGIFECLVAQNPSNQDSQLTWFFQTIGKAIIKQKTSGYGELFLSENDFQTSSTVNFIKEHPDFEGLETN